MEIENEEDPMEAYMKELERNSLFYVVYAVPQKELANVKTDR